MAVDVLNLFYMYKIKPTEMEITDIKNLPDSKLAEALLARLETTEVSENFKELIKEAATRLQTVKSGYITPHDKFFKWIRDRLVYQHKIDEKSPAIIELDNRLKIIFGENGNELNTENPTNDPFFTRVYDELIALGEDPNLDYMLSLKERIDDLFRKKYRK